MNELETMVLGTVMGLSNLNKLVDSGLKDVRIDDLWFTCPQCDTMQHSEGMVLVSVGGFQFITKDTPVTLQPLSAFFRQVGEAPDDIFGLDPIMVKDDRSIAVMCVDCARASIEFEELPVSDVPTLGGRREQ